MERDYYIVEENDVFISQWYRKPTNNTSEDIKKFSSSIEFMTLVDEFEKTLVHGLSYHLSARYKFGIELVQNIFEVVSLNRLFCIEELKEFLNKLWSDVLFESFYFNGLMNN